MRTYFQLYLTSTFLTTWVLKERQLLLRWTCLIPLFLSILVFSIGTPSLGFAQDGDWSVRNRSRRQQIILNRLMQIVEQNPVRGFSYRRMIQVGRRSPGLDRLVIRYRKKVKRYPKNLKYRLLYAHLLHTTRQPRKALRQYQEVVRRSPQMRIAHIYLAQAYRAQQHHKKAISAYVQALRLSKSKKHKRSCLKAMGALSLQLKKPQQALKYWQQFLELSPNDLRAREELALAMARYKLYDESLKQWNAILRRSRRNDKRSRIFRKRGQLYEQWNKWKQAVREYRKAMQRTRRGHWLRRELNERILQLHREHGKLPELVKYLKGISRKAPAEHAMLARLLDELGKNKKAAVAYKRALRVHPSNTKLRKKYITLLEVLNRIPAAIAQYRILVRRDPNEPRHRLAFTEMLSRVGKRKESLAEMSKLARRFSRNTEILNRLANLYRRRRMTKEAIKLYTTLIRLEPREAAHRRTLGQYYIQLGQTQKALSTWKSILSSGLIKHKAYTALGQILRDNNRLKEAHKWLYKALQSKPKNYAYLAQIGELYQRILDEDQELSEKWLILAIQVWKKLYKKAKVRTRKKRAMQQLFTLYHAQGTLYKLPTKYNNRITGNPKDIEALRWLGEYKLWQAQRKGRKSYYGAVRYFKRILQVQPKDLDALLTLEQLASNRANWRQARKLLLRAIRIHPRGRQAYYRRICNYSLKMGAFKDAIRYGRIALSLHPDSAASHADLARIYRRSKKLPKAIRSYREAIRLQPHSFSYYLALAKLLRTQGDTEKASRLYRHVVKNAKDGRMIYEAALHAVNILNTAKHTKQLESELQTLADANPRELAYFRALAELYRRQGRMKEYHIAYLKAAATVDQKSQVYKRLAEVAQEQGNLKKAIIYFRKMLEETPNPTPRSQIQLSSFHLQVGDRKGARKILLALLNEYPNSLRVLRQIASLFYKYNMVPESIRAYELFLDQEFNSSVIRRRLARLYTKNQQFEAAIGLLSEFVWSQFDRPILRKKKTKKNKAQKKKKLPYYLRRRRYYYKRRYRYRYRYRQNRLRQLVMGQLIDLYEQIQQLDQWDRRVIFAIQSSGRYEKKRLMQWVIYHYHKRKWLTRLERILQEARKQEPRNTVWILHLAKLYEQQERYQDAYALYTQIDRISPRRRQYNYINKIRVLLFMKDQARLDFLMLQFRSSHLGMRHYNIMRILRMLKKHKQFRQLEKILQWLQKNGLRRYKGIYLTQLISVYIRLNKRKKARVLLWRIWQSKGVLNHYVPLALLLRQRQTLLKQLWPLLSTGQQKWIRQHTEQSLADALLDNNLSFLRFAVSNMFALLAVDKGTSIAQEYLPAIWSLTSKNRRGQRLRKVIMRTLLQQGQYKVAVHLLRKRIKELRRPSYKLAYIRSQLRTLRYSGLLPPRIFSRFLERQLRQLRPQMHSHLWKNTALELADRYLKWGNYQRAIWWLELCRWSGGASIRSDNRFSLRIARAWRRKGNEKVAQRIYKRVVTTTWNAFSSSPERAYRHFFLKNFFRRYWGRWSRSPKKYQQYWKLYQTLRNSPVGIFQTFRKYRHRYKFRYLSYGMRRFRQSLNRRYSTQLKQAQASVQELFTLYVEAERKKELFRNLRKAWKNERSASKKKIRLYLLMGAYQLDWTRNRNESSLRSMLTLLQSSQYKVLPSKKRLEYLDLMAQLNSEIGQHKNALQMYKKLLSILPTNKRIERIRVQRTIAKLYGQVGDTLQQRKTCIHLSSTYQDGMADLWLARHYIEHNKVLESIRYYRQYQQRGARKIKHGRFISYHRKRPLFQQQLTLAMFLYKHGYPQQAFHFSKQSLGTLRIHKTRVYVYQNTIQRNILLLLNIGRLRTELERWKKEQAQRPADTHLLHLIYASYQMLEQPKNKRQVLAKIIKIKPYNYSMLYSLLTAYKRANKPQEAIQFLTKLYQKRTPKPKKYHLWMGRFFHMNGEKQKAYKIWKVGLEHCSKQASSYKIMNCRKEIGYAYLKVKGYKQALQVFTYNITTLRSSVYSWTVRYVLRKFIAQKAYKEAHTLIQKVLQKKNLLTTQYLSNSDIRLLGELIQVYKGLGMKKRLYRVLDKLENFAYKNSLSARVAAYILEREGRLIGAEQCYWQAFAKSRYSARQRLYAYNHLCAYWNRHGLQSLCDNEEVKTHWLSSVQRMELAKHFRKEGFPFLALLELRKLYLTQPQNIQIWQRLLHLSIQTGRLVEARLWLRKLRKKQPNNSIWKTTHIRSFASVQSKQKRSMDHHLLWRPVQIPGWCSDVLVNNGKLYTSKCKKKRYSCERHLLRIGSRLFTNDCLGRIIALNARTGRVDWIYKMPRLKEETTIDLKGNQYSSAKAKLLRFYQVQSLRAVNGKLFAAIHENGLESGKGWGSGIHYALHLIQLDPDNIKNIWKKSIPSTYVRSTISFSKNTIAFAGRHFHVLDRKTGRLKWYTRRGHANSAWLFGDKAPLPHTQLNQTFYIVGSDRRIRSYTESGRLKWTRKLPWQPMQISQGNQRLFTITDNEVLYALSPKTGSILWKKELPGGNSRRTYIWYGFSHDYESRVRPIVVKNKLIYASTDGYIRAFNTETGSVHWSVKVGDYGHHALQVSPNKQTLAYAAKDGTLLLLDVATGSIQWRYTLSPQVPYTLAQRAIPTTYTAPFVQGRNVWLGAIDNAQKFTVYGFTYAHQATQSRMHRLLALSKKLKMDKKKKLALRVLTRAVSARSSSFRSTFLRLARNSMLPLEQRIQWTTAYLSSVKDPHKSIQTVPKALRFKHFTLSSLRRYGLKRQQRERAQLKWLLMLINRRTVSHQHALTKWKKLIKNRSHSYLLALASPLTRRILSTLLRHSDPTVCMTAAYTLTVWGDQEGRKHLLQWLYKTRKDNQSYVKKLRIKSARVLFQWNRRFSWKGFVLPQDRKLVLPLLRANEREIRLRAAIFLGYLVKQNDAYRNDLGSREYKLLRRAISFPNKRLATLSAFTLGSLGKRMGVLHLRRMYNRVHRSSRGRIAHILQNQFDDHWGQRSIVRRYQGAQSINLSLPSFRIIYANLLLRYKQYNEALFHFQKVRTLSPKAVQPIHRTLALIGLGRSYIALKKYKLAFEKFRRAQQNDPYMAGIDTYVGHIHYKMGRLEQADRLFQKVVQRTGMYPGLLYNMLLIRLKQNQFAQAQELFRNTLRTKDRSERAAYVYVYVRAVLHLAPSRLQEIKPWIAKLLSWKERKPAYLFLQAKMLYLSKKTTRAQKTLNAAIRGLAPRDPKRPSYIKQFRKWFSRSPN